MSLAVLNSRIKKMECENKSIPQKYIDCFNDYIKKIINIRVDQEVEYLNDIIADKFELGKFKSVNELIYAYKNLEKQYTKSRQQIAELEEQLKNAVIPKFKVNDKIFVIVNDKIEEYYIDEVLLKCKGTLVAYRDICKETLITEKNEIFATEAEAQAKLEELKGE